MRHRYSSPVAIAAVLVALAVPSLTRAATTPRDPDSPPLPGVSLDKSTYLKLRDAQLRLLRGLPYDLPYDPRLKAIGDMNQKVVGMGPFISSTTWTPIGPSPIPNGQTTNIVTSVSGRVTSIAVHPTNPNIVYVGTAQGGVYRTLNGGTTWSPILDAAASLSIGALALAPSNPTILYVGTGEANFSLDSFFGVGLYRVDNADTAPVLTGPINPIPVTDVIGARCFTGRSIDRIIVHPSDPATIFVSTMSGASGLSGDPFAPSPPGTGLRGIYRSTDATSGAPSFRKLTVTPTGSIPPDATGNRIVFDMAMDPGDPNVLVCWVYGNPVAGDGGLYRTTNALALNPTFTQVMVEPDPYGPDRGTFAVTRVGGVTTFMLATEYDWAFGDGGRLWRSTDQGVTWTGPLAGGQGFCEPQCWYDIVVAMSPADANRVAIGGSWFGYGGGSIEYALSTDGAASFSYINNNGVHADTHAIQFAPSNASIVYMGDDGGIFKSLDGGLTWTSCNTVGFSATQFQGISVHPIDPNYTIGGTQDNGTNYYSPAATWQNVDYGDGGFTVIDQNAPNNANVTLYHTYFNASSYLLGYVRASSTADALAYNWFFFGNGSNGIGFSDGTNFYAPLVRGPGNPNTIYYGTDRLYRSADQGNTNVVVSQAPIVSGVPVSAIVIGPASDNVRLVGLNNGQVWGTVSGSSVLTNMTGGWPAKYVGRIAIDPTNANVAYVCLNGYGVPANQHVWKTTNLLSGTPAWAASGSGIPDVPVDAFAIDPLNPNQLFAGTDIGVYISNNGGATWLPFNTGLPVVAVFGMEIQNPSRILRIATHGRGMWERFIDTATPVLVSVVGMEIVDGHVRLSWHVQGGEGQNVNLYRRPVPGDWAKVGTLTADGTGAVAYDDADVAPGRSFEYTLGVVLNGKEEFSGQVWVDVPVEERLALEAVTPNPSSRTGFTVAFSLPNAGPATLEVVDVSGRQVTAREVGSMGPGRHQVAFGRGGSMGSGVYWVRLNQAGRTFSRKAVVVN